MARPRPRIDPVFVVMLALAALAGAGWLLAEHFVESSRIEDCAMQGRKNCAPVDDPNPR
ncbi:MAG TPA: hypothetical protein VMB50_24155 [Myxococcales bacterium]|nr:hypothetical protein [Myxococcales bacterium]